MKTKMSIFPNQSIFSKLLIQTATFTILTLMLMFSEETKARAADGDLDTTFNTAVDNGQINAIAVQADGKILIGGTFTTVGGVSRNGIARLNADGSLDVSFNPGTGANTPNVGAVALQTDGKILIGGFFSNVGGQARASLARLNADGSVDTGFVANASSTVSAIVVQPGGTILVGGFFSNINGTSRSRLAQLNADGSVTSFNTAINASFAQQGVSGIALQPDGKILINGLFSFNSRQNLARLNADGSTDLSFDAGFQMSSFRGEDVVVQPDGRVLAAIGFADSNRFGLNRFSATGTLETAFNPNAGATSNPVFAVYLQPDGKIVIGGTFTTVSGTTRNNIARLNADGSLDAAFATNANGAVLTTVSQADGKLLIGGAFTTVNDSPRLRIVRLLNNPGTPTATRRTVLDFDGDGKSDYAVARAADAVSPTVWYINNSSNQSASAVRFGTGVRGFGFTPPADVATPEDFDGDGKTDIAVWRAGDFAYFYILQSSNNTFRSEQFGRTGDNPTVIRDYDGDGKADLAVYREGTTASPQSFWYYRPSGTPGVNFRQTAWGAAGDFVAPGDYDGDGKGDFVVYRNVNGSGVFLLNKSAGGSEYVYFGLPTDQINPGDYDGDGKTDFALSRYDTSNPNNPVRWFILTRAGGGTGSNPIIFGGLTDFTAQGDYDGDGKTDIAVWRRANGTFYVRRSGDGGFQSQQWGQQGDYPVGYYNAH